MTTKTLSTKTLSTIPPIPPILLYKIVMAAYPSADKNLRECLTSIRIGLCNAPCQCDHELGSHNLDFNCTKCQCEGFKEAKN